MNVYNQVKEYNIVHRCDGSYISDSDMGFICGLLRDNKPKKILELGVAKGGSTVDLLNCIKELEIDCEMYSVDLFERYFEDQNLKTGYLADQFKKENDGFEFHKMILGKVLAQCLDEIGDDIDFVFMDTSHRIPGEVIDFLAIYPYLAPNAIIVLDDLKVHYYQDKRDIACTVLFQTVVAEKYLNTKNTYPNVGAFRINKDTEKYLINIFNSLIMPWTDIPDKKHIVAYDNIYSKYYSGDMLKIWNYAKNMALYFDAVNNNQISIYKSDVEALPELLLSKNVYLYGVGKRGNALYKFLLDNNVEVAGFVVSNGHKMQNECNGITVCEMSELKNLPDNHIIIQAVLSEAVSITLVASEYEYLILSEILWQTIEFGQ